MDECSSQIVGTPIPPPELVDSPKNLAAIEGESATMNCTVKYFSEFGALQWTYLQSSTEDVYLPSNNDYLLPGYENYFDITGKYNLLIKNANNVTAGLYLCTAFDRDVDGIFLAFFSTLGRFF